MVVKAALDQIQLGLVERDYKPQDERYAKDKGNDRPQEAQVDSP
jgi:hypothetical protein